MASHTASPKTPNFQTMKFSTSRILLALSVAMMPAALVGCGGGGGSSAGPSVSIAPTPVPQTGVNVTVQLRDGAGAAVEGLVTLDGKRRATTGGNAAFANVSGGSLTASAEVNGMTYSRNFVATLGANTVQIAIDPAATTPPNGTPPAPPNFERFLAPSRFGAHTRLTNSVRIVYTGERQFSLEQIGWRHGGPFARHPRRI